MGEGVGGVRGVTHFGCFLDEHSALKMSRDRTKIALFCFLFFCFFYDRRDLELVIKACSYLAILKS